MKSYTSIWVINVISICPDDWRTPVHYKDIFQLLKYYRRADREYLKQIIMCNETWMYNVIPETKVHSMTWTCPLSPTPLSSVVNKETGINGILECKRCAVQWFYSVLSDNLCHCVYKTQCRLKKIVHWMRAEGLH